MATVSSGTRVDRKLQLREVLDWMLEDGLIDAEPATITNFNGFVGLAYISGMVTRTNVKTGEKMRLPFVDSDMRFMKGEFRGTDGRMHHGAFAFI